jgi:hypothetical protein
MNAEPSQGSEAGTSCNWTIAEVSTLNWPCTVVDTVTFTEFLTNLTKEFDVFLFY